MKKCPSCKLDKPSNAFGKLHSTKDGLGFYCKDCRRSKSRAQYIEHKESILKQHKEYVQTPSGRAAQKRWNKKYRRTQPVAALSHYTVKNALRDGKIEKHPCEVCGTMKVEAHHNDYSKALEVSWLCKKHHQEWHKENQPLNKHLLTRLLKPAMI